MIFNMRDPPLLAGVWINADEFVQAFSMPCINHHAPFLSVELVLVITDNPLSLSLLIVLNRLFPPIYAGGRARQVLRRASWSSIYLLTLVKRSGRAWDSR